MLEWRSKPLIQVNWIVPKKFLLAALITAGFCITNVYAQEQKPNEPKKVLDLDKAKDALDDFRNSFSITDAEITKASNEMMKLLDSKNRACGRTDLNPATRRLATRLAKVASEVPPETAKRLNLNILAYNMKDINAFASPNGDIRIFAGMMNIMTDDQLLAIIGHEIGHIDNKDAKNRLVTGLRASAIKKASGAVTDNTLGKVPHLQLGEIAVSVAELGESFLNAQYSQQREFQADIYGYEFLEKCGKDPSHKIASLEALLKLEQGRPSKTKPEKLFSSHPDTKKRIEALKKRDK
jgi:putative metalloprotease